jgi:hypothetical protein
MAGKVQLSFAGIGKLEVGLPVPGRDRTRLIQVSIRKSLELRMVATLRQYPNDN